VEAFRGSVEELLVGLTPSQRAAVTTEAAPVCILASAGAGKTRVLVRRIAYRAAVGRVDPRRALALTFTRKAAGELQVRLRQLGLRHQVSAGTFHALASAQLHQWWADRGEQPPTLLERKARLLASLAASRPLLAHVPVAELAGHIEWAKARLVTPAAFESAVRDQRRVLPPTVPAAAVASLYARYENEKVRRGVLDFDDLLARCADAMAADPTFAAAQHWRWRHVFVDEFQDLNPLQHRLLLAWLGSSTDLCVVGDPHQAVYSWNGADPKLLAEVGTRWPSTEVVYLDDNHRCTPQIVAAGAAVLGRAGGRLRSAAGNGPPPTIQAFPSETAEAYGIATALRRFHGSGRRWKTMAVLTRTNAQLVPIRRALINAGIPCWSPAQHVLLEDAVARATLTDLRRHPRAPMQAVVADLAALADESADAEDDQRGGQAGDTRNAGEDRRNVIAGLVDLAQTFHRQQPDSTAGQWLAWLPSALSDDPSGPAPADAVTLCSFHRAKGLEWEVVWLAGVELGFVPIGRAGSPAAEEEERRLLYVAVTRASVALHCSWARQRTFGARAIRRDPSPWLELIGHAAGDGEPTSAAVRDEPRSGAGGPGRGGGRVAGGSARGTGAKGRAAGAPAGRADRGTDGIGSREGTEPWRRRLRDQRRQLHDGGGRRRGTSKLPPGWPEPDPDLLSALRAWRAETARAAAIPAYVVLHDVTLAALAARRPRSTEELLQVPGLGPVKAGRYGPTLLSLVSDRAAAG
jgi:DNA helicase-2/ATP-dependent DNA helicase PcrA